MKKNLYLFINAFFFVLLTQAQIQLNSSNMPLAGWNHKVAKDTLIGTQNWGAKGANQSYIFTNFQVNLYDTILYKPLTTAQQSSFPNADVAVTTDNTNYIFTNTTSSDFRWEGIAGVLGSCNVNAVFSPVLKTYQFPTTYQGNFNGSSGFQQQIAGSCVGQPVDAVRATNTTNYVDTIDGWGTVTTPVGTYNCLRQKRIEYSTTLVEYRLLAISPWTVLTTVRDTNLRYYYLTKETKGSVITFDYDSLDNPIRATWSTIPPAPTADFGANVVGGNNAFFTDSSQGISSTYLWNFGDGSSSTTASPNHTYSNVGTYYVCLTVTNDGGSSVYCDSVHITNIPPNAANDLQTTLQPANTSLNVGTNDNDPNGNSYCISQLIGNSNFSLSATNCTTINYLADSAFIGMDSCKYIICDNGTPVLCDTAWYIVTVNPNPALLPIANFNYTFPSCDTLLVVNSTSNADSIVWTQNNRFRDTMIINVDSVIWTDFRLIDQTVITCLTAFNRFGSSSLCDTINYGCEGIEEIRLSQISISPNPASSYFALDLSRINNNLKSEIEHIALYDLLGKNAMQWIYDKSDRPLIPLGNVSNGLYQIILVDKLGKKQSAGKLEIIH